MPDVRPRIAVIGTGGTISFTGRHPLDYTEYVEGSDREEIGGILARFPAVTEAAEVVPVDYGVISSTGVTPEDWLGLGRLVESVVAAEPCPDGVVITHGTASLEETAYFLNLTLRVAVPVVLVGAQRPTATLASDAGRNLLAGVLVAASPAARGLGVLTVLNDEIQAAREVTKTSTFRLQTFRSPDTGPLGYADADGRVEIYRRPVRRHAPDTEFDVRGIESLPRVDVVYCYAGADRAAVDAFVAAGAQGIVVAGFAPGMPSPAQAQALAEARAGGVLVVYSSRAGGGRVVPRPGLVDQGIVAADNLNPQKARVLTMLALTRLDTAPATVQRLFETY